MNKIFRSSMIIASFITAGFLAGCEKDDPEIEKTAVSEMAGEWYVKFEAQDASGNYVDPTGDGRSTFNVNTTVCERRYQAAPQGYRKIMTSSTSESESSTLLVTDMFGNPRTINFGAANARGNFYSFMVKANADLGAMTFSANGNNLGIVNALPAIDSTFKADGTLICPIIPARPQTVEDFNVTITDGKIIKGGSVPPSGTTTDSIHFMVKFGNDPNNRTYRVSGYRRTGFTEDEH